MTIAPEKTIGIIVARMSSSRLPGKALRPIMGKPLVGFILDRLQSMPELDEIWMATTQHVSDEPLIEWALEHNIRYLAYPGEIEDVVGRITATVNRAEAQRFVMVLADTPFPDGSYLSRLIQSFNEHPEWETVGAALRDTPCVHTGVGAYRTIGWKKIDEASKLPHHREHSASILREQPKLLVCGELIEPEIFYPPTPYRLTVDTAADFAFVTALAEGLGAQRDTASLSDVITYLDSHSELAEMNLHVRQRDVMDSSSKILIALQAGGGFGLGHLERCKTLARVLTEKYAMGVSFWIDSPVPSFRQEVLEQGYDVVHSQWSLAETIRQEGFGKLVIDFQDPVSPSFLLRIRGVRPDIPILVVDNNGMGCLEADSVVFPNVHAAPNPLWAEKQAHIYQGPEYVLLGKGFLAKNLMPGEVEAKACPSILITMGGTDPENLTEKALYALQDLKDCHLDVIVPRHYLYPENLEKIATRLPSTVTLHWRIDNLRPLMAHADIALATFGISTYELAYMGVPTLLLAHSPEQVLDVERFCTWGTALSLGLGSKASPEMLCDQVMHLLHDTKQRDVMSQKGKALIDGTGADRVAEVIVSTVREPVLATPES